VQRVILRVCFAYTWLNISHLVVNCAPRNTEDQGVPANPNNVSYDNLLRLGFAPLLNALGTGIAATLIGLSDLGIRTFLQTGCQIPLVPLAEM